MAEEDSEFVRLGLDPVLIKAVEEAFDIKAPSEIQQACLKELLKSENLAGDVLIRAKTGSGKTLAFLLPILDRLLRERRSGHSEFTDRSQSGTLALIIVPTRELATQTYTTLSTILGRLRGRDHWLVAGSLSGGDRRKAEKERLRKGMHLVVGTPGRILDHLENTERWMKGVEAIKWIILDEADRLQDSGFEKSIKTIFDKVQGAVLASNKPQPRLVLCSATVREGQKEIFGVKLDNPILITMAPTAKNLTSASSSASDPANRVKADEATSFVGPSRLDHYYLCPPTKFRLATLAGYLEGAFSSGIPAKIVLFTICCDTVDYLHGIFSDESMELASKEVKIHKLHGNLEHRTRMETFAAFTKSSNSPCLLVCTDIAARGLNLSHVTCIIQYDAPCDSNDYIHRAGRTARLQEEAGRSILFLMPSERDYLAELAKKDLSIKALRWEPLVERVAKRAAIEATPISPSKDDSDAEEDSRSLSRELRDRVLVWLEQLQTLLKGKQNLFPLAKSAYLSFIRAYATHPAAEKAIFHIKKLHLGHLAATFLLTEAPKSVAYQQQKRQDPLKDDKRRKAGTSQFAGNWSQNKGGKAPMAKPKRIVSEFGAGDVGAAFLQPRKRSK